MTYAVAISVSWKFEDLNVLLEILKLNFHAPIKTYVICNANEETYNRCSHLIEMDLVDHFDWRPTPGCYPGNPDRETKRKQPLDMFRRQLWTLRDGEKSFCFLEGDCFPLSEQHFLEGFGRLESLDVLANGFDFSKVDPKAFDDPEHRNVLETTVTQAHKMPDGYIYPGGMYMSQFAADESLDVISQFYNELIDGKRNFEGMLGTVFKRAKLRRENYSDRFCYTYPKTNQLDPVTKIIHHHNVMNLRDSFLQHGIDKGTWVQKVLQESSYTRLADGVKIERDSTPVEECRLVVK